MILDAAAGSRPAHPAPARKESEYPIPEMVETCLALNLNIYIIHIYICIYIYVICVPLDFRETTNDVFSLFFFQKPEKLLDDPLEISLQPLLDVATPPSPPQRRSAVATAVMSSSPMHAVHPGHVAESAVVPGGSAEVAEGWGVWLETRWEYMGIYVQYIYIYTDLFL